MESPCRWKTGKGQRVELHLIPWNIILALKLLILHLWWRFSPNLGFSTLGDYCVGPAVMMALRGWHQSHCLFRAKDNVRMQTSVTFSMILCSVSRTPLPVGRSQRPCDTPNTRYSTKSCGLSTDISSWSFAWMNSFYVFYSRILDSCSYLCFCQLPFLSLLPFLKPKAQENPDQMRCRIYYFLGSPNPS